MIKVLVTGGTGYIGISLIRHLALLPDYQVIVIVRPTSDTAALKSLQGSIEILASDGHVPSLTNIMRSFSPDVVVHLASMFISEHQSSDVESLIDSNVKFGVCLLEAMLQAGVTRLINTGTSWETMDGPPAYRPVCLYAATKRAFEDILRYYEDAHSFKCLTIKLYDTYGPKDPRPKLFALLQRNLGAAHPIAFSPGEQSLDLVHIDDVVDAYQRAIEYVVQEPSQISEPIYIGSGVSTRLRDVVALFEEIAGGKVNIGWGERSYRTREIMAAQANTEPALRILGWQARINLKAGIKNSFFGEEL